jgi:hypothetical protein
MPERCMLATLCILSWSFAPLWAAVAVIVLPQTPRAHMFLRMDMLLVLWL